ANGGQHLPETGEVALGIAVEDAALLNAAAKQRQASGDAYAHLDGQWCLAETAIAHEQVDRVFAQKTLDQFLSMAPTSFDHPSKGFRRVNSQPAEFAGLRQRFA